MEKIIASLFVDFLPQKPQSSLRFNSYPTLRDHPLHTAEIWLEGKRIDDGAENLWRIHDNLYDFTSFIHQHPGGEEWLQLSKGTDITEIFECHHISILPEKMLEKYYIREAKTIRNSPFSLKENGFYRTLKRNVREIIDEVPDNPAIWSKIYTDSLFVLYLSLAIASAIFNSFSLAVLSGVIMSTLSIAAHNFFHQRDNFRMYYFNFTLMTSRMWRVTHVFSHHIYTNTVYDAEISSIEPWFQHLPVQKHFFWRYLSLCYAPIVYLFMFPIAFIRSLLQLIRDKGESFTVTSLIPFTILLLMLGVSSISIGRCLILFIVIILVGSFHFGVVGLNAAHHHPKIFHDGDAPRMKNDLDWGLHEIDAVMDRTDINGNHFLVLTNFGDHCLHHLFPTIDHGRLKYLYPVFEKTCEQFNIKLRITTQKALIFGQFKQLTKVEPTKTFTNS